VQNGFGDVGAQSGISRHGWLPGRLRAHHDDEVVVELLREIDCRLDRRVSDLAARKERSELRAPRDAIARRVRHEVLRKDFFEHCAVAAHCGVVDAVLQCENLGHDCAGVLRTDDCGPDHEARGQPR
jgi:hypothetical protein